MSEEQSSQKSSQEGKTKETKAPCPVPAEHVKLFAECCEKYERGEISDLDVMIEVGKSLKELGKAKAEATET